MADTQSDSHQSLPDIALAFAVEVKGWLDARLSELHDNLIVTDSRLIPCFEYADLSDVMVAVQSFCDKRDLSLCLSYRQAQWAALLISNPAREELAETNDADLKVAMMMACLDVARGKGE